MYRAKELFKKTFIYVGEDMYEVIRVISETPDIDVNAWKQSLSVETAFRKDGALFFVNKVQEPEYSPITESQNEFFIEPSTEVPESEEQPKAEE